MFVFAMILGIKVSKAFQSAVTIGIGFIGLELVLELLTDSLGQATLGMVEQFDFHLHTIDIGWPASAAISYGTVLGSLEIQLEIRINIILLTISIMSTLNIDIWNY